MSVINLRQVRKERARAEKRTKGDENAAKFGQSKAEKALSQAEAARLARGLDGHKRETDDD